MALDQSALLEVLEALKAAEVDDRIRTATEALDKVPTRIGFWCTSWPEVPARGFVVVGTLEALRAADVDDRIRSAATTIYQALIEAELTAVIGAAPHERTDARTAQRNGSRPRTLTTTAGDLELRIPKLRAGSFFPSLLERRRRIDQALFAVVMEAWPICTA